MGGFIVMHGLHSYGSVLDSTYMYIHYLIILSGFHLVTVHDPRGAEVYVENDSGTHLGNPGFHASKPAIIRPPKC